MTTTPLRTVGLGPVIDDPTDITDDTPDSAVVSINVAAYLTGHTAPTLRKLREYRRGPNSFVLNRTLRYRLGDLRAYDKPHTTPPASPQLPPKRAAAHSTT